MVLLPNRIQCHHRALLGENVLLEFEFAEQQKLKKQCRAFSGHFMDYWVLKLLSPFEPHRKQYKTANVYGRA